MSYVQIKRAAICWHRLTAHLQYVRYQNIMYRLFGQAERKIICIIITMLVSTEQIPIFAAAIKSAKSAQTGAKGYAGFYADSTLQSTWQA